MKLILFIVIMLMLAGCAHRPPAAQTTFLNAVDLQDMTDRMAMSFAEDPEIASRDSTSPPWIISINRMTNHTNEIIPNREKWLYVARLRALLGSTGLARNRNMVWIIPPERWADLQSELGSAPSELRLPPTHQMSAEFTSLTNTSRHGRSDAYLCEYRLVDLATGELIWTDFWEVKRAATGLTFD